MNNMSTLLQELDKAIEDKRILMIAEYNVFDDMYRIYLRDITDNTEHLYTLKGVRRYANKID